MAPAPSGNVGLRRTGKFTVQRTFPLSRRARGIFSNAITRAPSFALLRVAEWTAPVNWYSWRGSSFFASTRYIGSLNTMSVGLRETPREVKIHFAKSRPLCRTARSVERTSRGYCSLLVLVEFHFVDYACYGFHVYFDSVRFSYVFGTVFWVSFESLVNGFGGVL